MGAFLGMRGTGDFVTNEVQENWRQYILELNPNGSTVITGIAAMMKSEPTDSTTYHWWTRTMPSQGGAVAGIYINDDLSTAYVRATHQATRGIAGQVLFAKVALAVAKEFREGHMIRLEDTDRSDAMVMATVIGVVLNGASSYIAFRLLEADDNSATPTSYNLSTVDKIAVSGNLNPQGGVRPSAITYDPEELYNYTGIFRTSLELTRTAIKEKLRTRNAYQDAKDMSLLIHGVEMEKARLFSLKSSGTGANGKPLKTPMGIREFILTYNSTGYDDYSLSTDADYAGKTWLAAGEDWLDEKIWNCFNYVPDSPGVNASERVVVGGLGAIKAINKLIKRNNTYTIERGEIGYGIKVGILETNAGTWYLKSHPLFTQDAVLTNSLVVFPPAMMIDRPFEETDFKQDDTYRKGGGTGVDGPQEEWLTEMGWEFHHAPMWAWLNGVGVDNVN